jgi:alkylation response protein AidB-like acyl-CoA dehydrogenase
MPVPKPHRALIGRVTGYADEAASYLRRRRMTRRPFARVSYPGGRTVDVGTDSEAGRALFLAAAKLIDAAR